MNAVIKVKFPAFRKQVLIEKTDRDDDLWIVSATGFLPFSVEASDPAEAFRLALQGLGSMRRDSSVPFRRGRIKQETTAS